MTPGYGNYSEVLPGLYQGSMPTRRQEYFYEPFDHVVVCTDPEYAHLWTYVPKDPERSVAIVRFAYRHEDLSALLQHAEHAASVIRSGRRVLVVCSSGVYRSSLFVSLVQMYLGTPLDEALQEMVASQPGWSVGSANIFAESIRAHLKELK